MWIFLHVHKLKQIHLCASMPTAPFALSHSHLCTPVSHALTLSSPALSHPLLPLHLSFHFPFPHLQIYYILRVFTRVIFFNKRYPLNAMEDTKRRNGKRFAVKKWKDTYWAQRKAQTKKFWQISERPHKLANFREMRWLSMSL